MKKTKSTLAIQDVEHIANLAKLNLSKDELIKFQKQLSLTLDYIKRLNQIDTGGMGIPYQIIGLENIFREDKIRPSLPQKQVLKNSTRTYKGFFVTEAVLDE